MLMSGGDGVLQGLSPRVRGTRCVSSLYQMVTGLSPRVRGNQLIGG